MANEIDLLKVKYDRVIGTETVTLTDDNYQQYGFLKNPEGHEQGDVTLYYYKYDSDLEENVYYATTDVDVKQHYEHILPNPTTFTHTYYDVDKDGSGRNESTGQMQRERIGHYTSIDVTWNIVENQTNRINLIRILRGLPPSFELEYHDSDNEISNTKIEEFYRADISEDLYMFIQGNQIWRGLATSFIQFDVTPYDDSQEPTLLV